MKALSKTPIFLYLLMTLLISSGALALDLKIARANGLVKELPNGYIEAVDSKAKSLVQSINSKRKAAYIKIAKKNKVSVDIVAAQAAKKIAAKLAK